MSILHVLRALTVLYSDFQGSQNNDHQATSSLGGEQRTDGRKYTPVRQDVSLLVLITCFRHGVYFILYILRALTVLYCDFQGTLDIHSICDLLAAAYMEGFVVHPSRCDELSRGIYRGSVKIDIPKQQTQCVVYGEERGSPVEAKVNAVIESLLHLSCYEYKEAELADKRLDVDVRNALRSGYGLQ